MIEFGISRLWHEVYCRGLLCQVMTSCILVFTYTFCRKALVYVCRRWLAGVAGLNPAGDMDICVLSGRGLCDGWITRPEESYQVCH